MNTLWRIKGDDVRTLAINVLDARGWDSYAGKRGGDYVVPFRHGERFISGKSYATKHLGLRFLVMDTDDTGAVVHAQGRPGHLRENLDLLMGLFTSHQQISVEREITGMPVREALVEADQVVVVDTVGGDSLRVVEATFKLATPFWRELPEVTGAGPPTLTNDGNAPIGDAVLTYAGAGVIRLTNSTSGTWLEVDLTGGGSNVEVDVGLRRALQGSTRVDGLLNMNTGRWMEFLPGANSLAVTGGTVTVDYYHKWH